MLNNTLGVSFLAGVGVILALIPINGRISVLARRAQVDQLLVKDERVKLMNEILAGMKVTCFLSLSVLLPLCLSVSLSV